MRVLIAEDDRTMLQVMATFLSRKGIPCSVANDGLSAVQAWEAGDYDLILMDVQMPGVDGLKATRMIREKETSRGGHTVIIAITAYAMSSDREKCLEAGMDDHVSKPIDFDHLISLIRKNAPEQHNT